MARKVLIADDDALLRTMLQDALEEAGYHVSLAADGLEAWQKIQDSSPDCLVLDLAMPRLDGARLCRYLKADPRLRSLPVIILSGMAVEASQHLEYLGAEAFIPKRSVPAMVRDLLCTLQAFENGNGNGRPLNLHSDREGHPRQIVVELLAETSHLTAILQNLGEGILVLDPGWRLLYMNPAGAEILQRSESELLGTELLTILEAQAEGPLGQAMRQLAAPEGPATIRLSDTYREQILQLTLTNLLERGNVAGRLLLLRDVTPFFRRIRELTALNEVAALFTSTLKLDEVLRRVMERVQVLLQAEAGSLLLKDPEAEELVFRVALGEHAQALEGRRLSVGEGIAGWVFREGEPVLVPDVQKDPRFFRAIDRATGFVTRSMLCVPLRARDRVLGVVQVLNSLANPFFTDEDLNLLSAIAAHAAAAIDNALLYEQVALQAAELERKVQERTRELQAANRRLEAVSRHKSEFLANMSHELRTPLNSIIGFAELLQERSFGPLTQKQARHVENILNGGCHLLALINDLLDLSKVEAGKFKLRLETFHPRESLEAALREIQPQADTKGLHLSLASEPDLPRLTADPVRFMQILLNVLSNAVKFTPEGGRITVTARRVSGDAEMGRGGEPEVRGAEEQGGGGADQTSPLPPGPPAPRPCLEVSVQDTGIGIKPEDLAKLCQPFTQLEPVFAKQYQGTGLGLALTKRMVELHGGQFRAESEGEGKGSTFTIRLPLAPPGNGQEGIGREAPASLMALVG